MDLANNNLHPHERAIALNSAGFDLKKTRGQINNIKNIAYDDENPDLCINLNTGMVRDFGNPDYNGDIINLIGKVLGKNFKETISFIESAIGRNLSQSPDGIDDAKTLYGDPVKKELTEKPAKFWNKQNWAKMEKCMQVLEKRGIPKGMEYIQDYDGISLETLKKCKCGIYGFDDFEFGLSKYDYNKDLYYVFPYATGAMLYRRTEEGKDVKHIKHSKSKLSFYNIWKEDKRSNVVFLMKSPRECMNFMHYNTDFKVIGLVTGEEIGSLNVKQQNQLRSILSDSKSDIYCIFDCDNPDAYEKSLKSCQEISKTIGDLALVRLVNIHRNTKGKYKDFTDLVQKSMKKKSWNPEDKNFTKLEEKISSMFIKSLMEAEVIK